MLTFKEKKFKDTRRNVEIKDYKNSHTSTKRIFIHKIGPSDRSKDKLVYEAVESLYTYITHAYHCDSFIHKTCQLQASWDEDHNKQ